MGATESEPGPVGNGAEQPSKASQGTIVRADQKGETEIIKWLGEPSRQTLSPK